MFLKHFLRKLYLVCYISFLYICCINAEGCTAPNLLPDKPFVVVWNHPTFGCEKRGRHLGLEEWGIVNNYNDQFFGEDIGLFYDFGKFPQIAGNGTVVNGGIPQLGNLSWHLEKTKRDVNAQIPEPDFSGLGVIDFESWRPCYKCNFDALRKYQKMSLELAKKRFPLFTPDQLLQEATKEFEDAARKFIYGGLSLARELRPNGRWGYYGYPRCWGADCNTTTITVNDKMEYIWNTSTGLYPSIYFKLDHPPKEERERKIKMRIHETLRIKAKYSPHNATIFPYSKNQDGPIHLFSKDDLDDAIGEAANMGAAGIVLWGSSSSLRYHNECTILQNYIHNTLGPYVQNISNFFGNCSQQLCNGHGRCVRKDNERIFQYYLKESQRRSCLIDEENLISGASIEKDGTMVVNSKNSNIKTSLVFKYSVSVGLWRWWDFSHTYRHYKRSSNVLRFPGPFYVLDNTDANEKKYYKNIKLSSFNIDGYDFDDYVCKCFDNWSGIRCNVKS